MARQLKYGTHDIDLERLRRELGSGDDPAPETETEDPADGSPGG
ncbi:hypothetical protein J2S55_001691 [Streptosporangium brasiliense]|uniref:DUF3073 domain-containing protein n=1 Tax=Streptosporangium brasiliense TaxID=47480 RepID=A0ABT9R0R0_9ACTN|nr:hypothetical protein [Streptosporangium brasiliense]